MGFLRRKEVKIVVYLFGHPPECLEQTGIHNSSTPSLLTRSSSRSLPPLREIIWRASGVASSYWLRQISFPSFSLLLHPLDHLPYPPGDASESDLFQFGATFRRTVRGFPRCFRRSIIIWNTSEVREGLGHLNVIAGKEAERLRGEIRFLGL